MHQSIKKLFSSFSSSLIDDIEKNAVIQEFKAGDVIMRTGQYIKNTVLVLSGSIKIYREDDDGGEFFMYYLQPGQACAISMICATKNEQSQIMAKVIEDVELVMVPLPLMDKWMMQHRSWYEFVIDTYRSRFEEVLEVVDSIAFRAMDERLEFYLKRHKDACGCNDLKLSHQEIATELNTSREVISRLLKKLEQRGELKLHRNHIELLK
jgi:CRP/FNR family transcriptional regulator